MKTNVYCKMKAFYRLAFHTMAAPGALAYMHHLIKLAC